MSDSTVQGSVTLRKLKTGTTAQVTLSSTMQLFQLYKDMGGGTVSCVPDWSGDNTHPKVKVNLSSSSSETFSGVSVAWYINNTDVGSMPGIYQGTDPDGTPCLEINTNLAEVLGYNSGTLTAVVSFSDRSGNTYQVSKNEVIRIQEAVDDGYYVFIDATGTVVNDTTSVTLRATLRKGTVDASDNSGVSFGWYTSTAQHNTPYQARTLNVTAGMVNGSQLFICRAKVSGREVDAESIMITDTSDPLRLTASVQQYKSNSAAGIPGQDNVTSVDVASENDKTTVTFKPVYSDGSAYSGTANWEVVKRHAGTARLIKAPSSGADYTTDYTAEQEETTAVTDAYSLVRYAGTATASIDVVDADFYTPDAATGKVIKDEVLVTAEATINS